MLKTSTQREQVGSLSAVLFRKLAEVSDPESDIFKELWKKPWSVEDRGPPRNEEKRVGG